MRDNFLRVTRISNSIYRVDLTTDPDTGLTIDDNGNLDLASLKDAFIVLREALPRLITELDEVAAAVLIGAGRRWTKYIGA
jgi:hypothetical protein